MKITQNPILAMLLLSLATPCVYATNSVEASSSKEVITEVATPVQQENKSEQLGKKLLETLISAAQKNIQLNCANCPCCPCCPTKNGASCTQPDAEATKKLETEKEEDIKKALELIKQGADVNYQDQNQANALNIATGLNNIELIKALLEKKADPNAGEIISPLMTNTMMRGDIEIAKLLIDNGADVNFHFNKNMFTPLYYAMFFNNFDLATLLIQNGADVNAEITIQMPGQAEMKTNILLGAIELQNFDMIEFLLENKTNPNVIAANGKTALANAKELGHKRISDLLIKYGATE